MESSQHFLIIMAAISTASQKLTDQLAKGRFLLQLGTRNTDPVLESRRQAWIHLICGLFGIALCAAVKVDPLQTLRGQSAAIAAWTSGTTFLDLLATGVLVSFGGSFFNELLGALQQFKDVQGALNQRLTQQLAANAPAGGVAPSDIAAFPGAPAAPIAAVPPPAIAMRAAVPAQQAAGAVPTPEVASPDAGGQAIDATGPPEATFRDEDAHGYDDSYFDQDVDQFAASAEVNNG